jgi:mono/diheme cytochrome c family protein
MDVFADAYPVMQNIRARKNQFRRMANMEVFVESTCVGCGEAVCACDRRLSIRRAAPLAIFLACVMTISARGASAAPAPDAAQLFSVNCVVCHGQDGKGTDTGKSLMAPDLHSDMVQKRTNAMLTQAISEGKNNMPPFMSTLSKADIQNLVVYVRGFGKKAK